MESLSSLGTRNLEDQRPSLGAIVRIIAFSSPLGTARICFFSRYELAEKTDLLFDCSISVQQLVYEEMKNWAKRFPEEEQPALLDAARTWRLPYWDWALKKKISGPHTKEYDYDVPIAVKSENVQIKLPLVVDVTGFGKFPNALHHFTMPNNMTMSDSSLGNSNPLLDLKIAASTVKSSKGPREVTISVSLSYASRTEEMLIQSNSTTNAGRRAGTQK
jgi:hypothetical protein